MAQAQSKTFCLMNDGRIGEFQRNINYSRDGKNVCNADEYAIVKIDGTEIVSKANTFTTFKRMGKRILEKRIHILNAAIGQWNWDYKRYEFKIDTDTISIGTTNTRCGTFKELLSFPAENLKMEWNRLRIFWDKVKKFLQLQEYIDKNENHKESNEIEFLREEIKSYESPEEIEKKVNKLKLILQKKELEEKQFVLQLQEKKTELQEKEREINELDLTEEEKEVEIEKDTRSEKEKKIDKLTYDLESSKRALEEYRTDKKSLENHVKYTIESIDECSKTITHIEAQLKKLQESQ